MLVQVERSDAWWPRPPTLAVRAGLLVLAVALFYGAAWLVGVLV